LRPSLSEWIEVNPGDWRRYWYVAKPILVDGKAELDLAAIIGKRAVTDLVSGFYGFRVFNPEGSTKWIREGGSLTIEDAKDQADQYLRAMYGVPPRKQEGQ
jgi:hypothetical protein